MTGSQWTSESISEPTKSVKQEVPLTCLDWPTLQGERNSGPGVSGSAFDPAIAGPGTHVIGYTYSLATVYDTVDVIGFAVSLTPSHPLCAGDPTGSVVPEDHRGACRLSCSIMATPTLWS